PAEALRIARNCGRVSPKNESAPTFSTSRRLTPSQLATGRLFRNTVFTISPPAFGVRHSAFGRGGPSPERPTPNAQRLMNEEELAGVEQAPHQVFDPFPAGLGRADQGGGFFLL